MTFGILELMMMLELKTVVVEIYEALGMGECEHWTDRSLLGTESECFSCNLAH